MPWTNGDAHDAAREAQLDHALTGVIGYHPAEHSPTEGPLNVTVGSSSSGIELDVNGGPTSIRGERVETPPSAISLNPGDADNPRKVIIYVDESGGLQSLPGAPADNTIVDMEGNEYSPVGSQAPVPEPASNAHRISGAIIAVVWVPAGATDSSDLNQNEHVHDRRRPAPDTDQGLPRQPVISDRVDVTNEEGSWDLWPIVAWPNQTIRLWEYTMTAADRGMFGGDDYHIYLISYTGEDVLEWDDEEGTAPWEDYAVWDSTESRIRGSSTPDEPIVEVDTGHNSTDAHAFVVVNEGPGASIDNVQKYLQVTYTIEDTDSI